MTSLESGAIVLFNMHLLFLVLSLLWLPAAQAAAPVAPRLFLWNPDGMVVLKSRVQNADTNLVPALTKLKRDADQELKSGPFHVMLKDALPPSGDKHDYMSLAPYFWPNPKTSNGLPYIRRDGERNPEIYQAKDRTHLGNMIRAVETLSLAYFYTGDDRYSAKASRVLRDWFLDPATRMNPNFKYAQAIRGINDGRGIGLIETAGLVNVVEGVGLLQGAKDWTDSDQKGLQDWFGQFLAWMRESPHGKDEAAAKNNHGTYYDMQIISFARFIGDDQFARKTLSEVVAKRMARQIEPSGRQPLELDRTKGWSYSIMNLQGWFNLASLGHGLQIDLWHQTATNGGSIIKACDYLLPFALGRETWDHQQLGGVTRDSFYPLLRRAAREEPKYLPSLAEIPPEPLDARSRLIPYR